MASDCTLTLFISQILHNLWIPHQCSTVAGIFLFYNTIINMHALTTVANFLALIEFFGLKAPFTLESYW